jgi:hypothetical protein
MKTFILIHGSWQAPFFSMPEKLVDILCEDLPGGTHHKESGIGNKITTGEMVLNTFG